MALSRALGGSGRVFEAADSPVLKASGRPGVNVGRIWSFMTTSVYQSGDLPVLAVREMVQNSLDAIRAAIRARQIPAGSGRIEVELEASEHRLTVADNGIGMDADTILSKFLFLGETGKADAGSADEAAGGFGVAKAVILGTSSTFRWEMHTRDNLARSEGVDSDVAIFAAPFRQGTRITLHDLSPVFDSTWDYARSEHVFLAERLHGVLAANDLPGIALTLNGAAVLPLFSRRGGSKVQVHGSWGAGTEATVKAYRRAPGDRSGAYYVRLGGLYQFKEPARRGNLKADVVVDLATTVRPGSKDYPLNAARDGLQRAASWAMSDLVEEVERENESLTRDKEDEVYEPEAEGEAQRQGTEDLAELTQSAFADPEFKAALSEAAGGLADFYRSVTTPPQAIESAAPSGTRRQADAEPTRTVPAEIRLAPPAVAPDIAPIPAAAGQLRVALAESDKDAKLPRQVDAVLVRIEQGVELDDDDVRTLDGAVEQAAHGALGPAGGGFAAAANLLTLADTIVAAAPTTGWAREQRAQRRRNPFGNLAGLRISRKHYDRAKGRRFKANFARWLPHLALWDSTLRLVQKEARIRRRFKPGFVLDDELLGLTASSQSGTAVIYLHPDRLAQVLKAHRERPIAIAAFLHGVACHELTHLDGRMGRGHDESFVAAREDLGAATAHLLPAISILVSRLLRWTTKPTPEAIEVERLSRRLLRSEGNVAELRAELRRVRSILAAATATASRGACGTCRCAERALLARVVAAVKPQLPAAGIPPEALDGFLARNEALLLDLLAKRRAA